MLLGECKECDRSLNYLVLFSKLILISLFEMILHLSLGHYNLAKYNHDHDTHLKIVRTNVVNLLQKKPIQVVLVIIAAFSLRDNFINI